MIEKKVLDILGDIGSDKILLTTDYFFEWAPPSSETMRMMIGTYLQLGMSEADVRKMVRTNPARLLGLTQDDLDRLSVSQVAQAPGDGRETLQ